MLGRLPPRQPGHPVAVTSHLSKHPVGVRPRVLPQRPADRLAEPERCRRCCCRWRGAGGRGRCRPCVQLADHGGAAQPQVRVGGPLPDHGRSTVGAMALQRLADEMGGDLVDHVPPRAGHDEVPPQRQRLGVQPRPSRAVPGERDGGVPLLAVRDLVPQRAHGRLVLVATDRPVRRQDRPQQPLEVGRDDAVVGQLRLHVRLLRRGLLRICRPPPARPGCR